MWSIVQQKNRLVYARAAILSVYLRNESIVPKNADAKRYFNIESSKTNTVLPMLRLLLAAALVFSGPELGHSGLYITTRPNPDPTTKLSGTSYFYHVEKHHYTRQGHYLQFRVRKTT